MCFAENAAAMQHKQAEEVQQQHQQEVAALKAEINSYQLQLQSAGRPRVRPAILLGDDS